MRSLLRIAAIVGCASSSLQAAPVPAPDDGVHFVTIGADALDDGMIATLQHDGGAVIEAGDGVALLFLPDRGLRTLAEQIHARFDRCGGFMVHDSLEEASDAYEAAAEAASGARAADARPGPGYTIDHGASVRAVLPALDRARIRDTIRELSAMPNRYYRSSSGAAASIWLRDRWRSFTNRADVTVELFETGYPQKSVILTIPGRARASEVVVIGGHLDSISLGGATGNAPGADDDASGIATLTEVARVLLASDYRPARTIQFIAYAAEEVGLRGSLQIANDYRRRHIDVVGALQLDMTNYRGSDKDIWLMKDFTSAAQNGFLGRLIDTYVGATWGYDACGYACSDHAAWHRTGVPASLPFEARMREANRAIHTRQDTLETSGPDAAHAVAFARLAAAYAIELGKGELAGPAPDPAPARRFEEVGAGSAGHPGAALSVALLILGLWVARRAIARTG